VAFPGVAFPGVAFRSEEKFEYSELLVYSDCYYSGWFLKN